MSFHEDIIVYLSLLLHDGDQHNETDLESGLLAVSRSNTTVCFRYLFDSESFDLQGRVLSIISGRLTSEGVSRSTLYERYDWESEPSVLKGPATELASGFRLVPSYYSSGEPTKDAGSYFSMGSSVTSDSICVSCFARCPVSEEMTPVSISSCLDNLFDCRVMDPCTHSTQEPFVVCSALEGATIRSWLCNVLKPFHSIFQSSTPSIGSNDFSHIHFHALRGSRIEQLLQMHFLQPEATFLQTESCLKCTVQDALRFRQTRGRNPGEGNLHIIMC